MKKLLVLGLFIAGFAMTSMAQNAAQAVENTPAIEVAKVAPAADAVAPVKACCKKKVLQDVAKQVLPMVR